MAEGDGFEEDRDEYAAENIFFVPEDARWSVISAAAHTPEIGTVIDSAMRSIERENKKLRDVLPIIRNGSLSLATITKKQLADYELLCKDRNSGQTL